mgnify:CR=1 FL=1
MEVVGILRKVNFPKNPALASGRGTSDGKDAAADAVRLRNIRLALEERRDWRVTRNKEDEEQLVKARKAAEKARAEGLGFAPSKPGKEDGQGQPHWVCWNERDGFVHCFRCPVGILAVDVSTNGSSGDST